jgi:hypothetical protein
MILSFKEMLHLEESLITDVKEYSNEIRSMGLDEEKTDRIIEILFKAVHDAYFHK